MREDAGVLSLGETHSQGTFSEVENWHTGWRNPLKGAIDTLPFSLNCSRKAPMLTLSNFVPATVLTLNTTLNGSEPLRFGSRPIRAHRLSSTPLQAS